MLSETLTNVGIGLSTATSGSNLLYCFLGVALGTFVGVLPGLGTMVALSIVMPLTFHLDPTTALIMLSGIWYGTLYGGAICSILLNVPGTSAAVVTCFDGYPLASRGRAGVALFISAVASYFGSTFGVVLTMFCAPVIAGYALSFGPAEYFSLIVMGLLAASGMSNSSLVKSIAMILLGILLGLVGTDIYTGASRLTFGIPELRDSIPIVALAMGVFGVSEMMASVHTERRVREDSKSISMRSMLPTRDEMKRSVLPMLRGAGVGSFFGILPGTGPIIASFFSYALEKNISKTPERFGQGAIEGIASPESANNAADQAAFIPTMTLGIPGSASMALMLGALMIHGISPGPLLLTEKPEMFWGIIMSFWIGNILLLVLNIPLIGIWIRMLTLPYHILYPFILMFICIGMYSVTMSGFNVWLVAVFGLMGYGMRKAGLPGSSLLLGLVLGPMMEEYFRRAMILSGGSFAIFFTRPISCAVLALTFVFLVWKIVAVIRKRPIPGTAGGSDE